MNCPEVIDFLEAYFAHELPPEVESDFKQHLKWCPDCCNYLASYRQTIDMGKLALKTDDELREVPPALIEAILKAAKK